VADWHGTYQFHWTATSGNCDTPADQLIDFDSAAGPPGGCFAHPPDRSANNCSVTTVVTCNDGSQVTTLMHETTAGAGVIDGTQSESDSKCSGEFSIHGVRQ
jgi:hypothetical protein